MSSGESTSGYEQTVDRSSAGLLYHAAYQTGLVHLYNTPTDVKLLLLQRYIRVTAYGAMALILVAYLRLVGISEARIGYFMTATLLGDVAVSMLLAAYGDRIGRRLVLIIGCSLMSGSGFVFAFSSSYWFLLAAAVFGVITPSGSDLGPFRIIEESTISHLTHHKDRPTIYGFYVLCGRFGAASGMLLCGLAMRSLEHDRHWDMITCYRAAFVFYSISGVIKLLFTCCLSSKCDETRVIKTNSPQTADIPPSSPKLPHDQSDTAPLLGDAAAGNRQPKKSGLLGLLILPNISSESRKICILMCFYVCFEYIGNAMASLSWLAYYFQKIYNVSADGTGIIFFTAHVCGGFMAIIGAAIARRAGNVRTIFGVALIGNAGLIVLGLVTSLPAAITAVIIRDSVQQADGAATMSFAVEIFLPSERTAALGLMSVFKTLASSVGPSITGQLVEHNHYWVVFIVAACSKLFYASGLLFSFGGHKSLEQAETEAAAEERESMIRERDEDPDMT